MGAPLISNLGFTEVSSAGSLNSEAGAKINLPIQLYKLIIKYINRSVL